MYVVLALLTWQEALGLSLRTTPCKLKVLAHAYNLREVEADGSEI